MLNTKGKILTRENMLPVKGGTNDNTPGPGCNGFTMLVMVGTPPPTEEEENGGP